MRTALRESFWASSEVISSWSSRSKVSRALRR
jgi:hypothetical protein